MTSEALPRYASINLPHAHTVLSRIVRWVEARPEPVEGSGVLWDRLIELHRLLGTYAVDPPPDVAVEVADQAATIARRLVEEIRKAGYRGDRLGQCVRNLFECLGLAAEGAELSLACGERPDSPLRP